jgi:hypothetical protein
MAVDTADSFFTAIADRTIEVSATGPMPVACTGIGQGSIGDPSAIACVSSHPARIHSRSVSNSSIAVAEPERVILLAGRMALELSRLGFRTCWPVPESKLNLLSEFPAGPWGQLAANQACGAA